MADIRRALDGTPDLQRGLALWLLPVVDRETRIALQPIAVRYQRNLRDVAEDFVQDVMLLLFREQGKVLRTWAPERGMQLRSFIALIVRRTIFRRFKGFRGNPWSSNPADVDALHAAVDDCISAQPSILAEVEYRMQLDEVLSALHTELSEREWRLFIKLYVEQRRPAEVGVEEGMKENAVHKWCSRFQGRVRQLFGQPTPRSLASLARSWDRSVPVAVPEANRS